MIVTRKYDCRTRGPTELYILRVGMRIYFLKAVKFHILYLEFRETLGSGRSSGAYAEAIYEIDRAGDPNGNTL